MRTKADHRSKRRDEVQYEQLILEIPLPRPEPRKFRDDHDHERDRGVVTLDLY